MDQPKFERLLRLMKLLTGNTSLSIDDLARKLNTTYRSVYRYIDTFKDAGFVVQKVSAGIYQLVSLNKKVPDLNKIVYFTDEEAGILSQLIEGLDNTNNLKLNLCRKLASVYECAPITDFIDKKSNAMNVRDLSDAIRGHRQVILKGYKSSNSKTTSDHHIEPFGFTTNHIYVWGYDYKDSKCKTFGISRIGETEILDAEWEHEAEHKTDDIDIFKMPGERKYKVVLRLGQMAHNLLLEEYPLAYKELHEDDNQWILDTKVSNMKGVGRFVIGLADDITIIDAPELIEYLKEFDKNHVATIIGKVLSDSNHSN